MVVKASVHQDDLLLSDNDVYTITGNFDINGSIIVEKNATLILRDAVVNFTQARYQQFNMTFRKAANGNPRLFAYNSTITSEFLISIMLYENSTAEINNSTIAWYLFALDSSFLSISNSSHVYIQSAKGSSITEIHNSTIDQSENIFSSQNRIYDSEIQAISFYILSANCTISESGPGLVGSWDFAANCSVDVLSGGSAPNVTLTNTKVNVWAFEFYGSCDATISDSTEVNSYVSGSSVIRLKSTMCNRAYTWNNSTLLITDSSIIDELTVRDSSKSQLINSTAANVNIHENASVSVCWYLDVHVTDSIGQDAPFANVTTTYPNSTVAESRLADANGWARLTLTEKTMNASGTYPLGNYTVTSRYNTHEEQKSVNVTGNELIVIPEFSSFVILSIFMMMTLFAVVVYKRRQSSIRQLNDRESSQHLLCQR
jgi:hypothetical protein